MGWGSLDPLYSHLIEFFRGFNDGYGARKDEVHHVGELLLTRRGWRMNIVEGARIMAIVTIEEHIAAGNQHGFSFPASQYPQIATVSDVGRMANLLQFGEVIDYRPFPYQHDFIEALLGGKKSTQENESAVVVAFQKAYQWGVDLADVHIADMHPPFDQAQDRMVSAYRQLFRLEQTLRVLIGNVLEANFGATWWDEVPDQVRKQVTARESQPTTSWFDDYSPSRFRFADFDGLRLTIVAHWALFQPFLEDKDAFVARMSWLSRGRNRVAHMNTLSNDDYRRLMDESRDIVDLVNPHLKLR